MQIAAYAALLVFLVVAIAPPRTWVTQKALIMGQFFILQGWTRVADGPAHDHIFGAAKERD